jgi:NitT/TauT family transport system substrate-binding protein
MTTEHHRDLPDPVRVSRRTFLAGACALGAAALLDSPRSSAAEPPIEARRIRLLHSPSICFAPQYVAQELLQLEGFEQVEYVAVTTANTSLLLAAGQVDVSMQTAPALIPALDAGEPIVVLAGAHAGCYELFGSGRIHAIRDLKGKRVAISAFGAGDHIFTASTAAYVGMDPRKDIARVSAGSIAGAMGLFVEEKVDAFIGFPPQPQELRARKIGHVVVDTAHDRPWSQYFCCMVAANRGFADKHPVATKRALRAILKAADICAQQPQRAARYMAKRGYEPRYEIGLEVLRALPYDRWRQYDPADTLRFYALRLYESGMIKSTPQKLLAQGADWRFLNELKKELKA